MRRSGAWQDIEQLVIWMAWQQCSDFLVIGFDGFYPLATMQPSTMLKNVWERSKDLAAETVAHFPGAKIKNEEK